MMYLPTVDGPTVCCLIAAWLVWRYFRDLERRKGGDA